MTDFTPFSALAGGALIGLSAALMLLGIGRIAGISSILAGTFQGANKGAWRGFFLVGLLAGTAIYPAVGGDASVTIEADTLTLVAGGLLVGLGTRMGGGCTSGHGVCGMSRLSRRSLVAVPVFMLCAGAVVFIMRHLPGAFA